MNKIFLSSKVSGKKSKLKKYISTIRPTVTYAAETWNLMDRDMNYLTTFQRRILTKIYGPVQEQDRWRIRTNRELNKLIGGVNRVRFIKAQRLKWWGQ